LALAAVINALWDLWARIENKVTTVDLFFLAADAVVQLDVATVL